VDPVKSADANFGASEVTNSHIIQMMRGGGSLQDHMSTTCKVKAELKNQITRLLEPMPTELSRTINRWYETGAWLALMHSLIASTELSSYKFCDSLSIRYGRIPAGLLPMCDECGAYFDTNHALSCFKGGLMIIRHNELRDKLCDNASRAFQPSVVPTYQTSMCVVPPKYYMRTSGKRNRLYP
jgi:hypothetical protein